MQIKKKSDYSGILLTKATISSQMLRPAGVMPHFTSRWQNTEADELVVCVTERRNMSLPGEVPYCKIYCELVT